MVVRSLNFMPDRLRTTLRFSEVDVINNAGFINANIRHRPTCAYDINPALGSTAMPGFTELGGMYRFYRVNKWVSTARWSNNETFPVQAYIAAVNFDPTVNTAAFGQYLSSRTSKKAFLGPLTGYSVATLQLPVSVASFGGSQTSTKQIDSYCGTTAGTIPTNLIWLIIGVLGGPVLVNGVSVVIDHDIDVDFFELANPAV